ncbi:MAG: SAM-dependent methyltransferase [Gammaproteobacteria bacterium]|nr:SAM-dependent methyltransferase [Gammaproteobacteria bacterium]
MKQPQFQDHFSGIANQYALFRPRYPSSLFEYLASLVSGHDLAWDCATGNGQAAVALAQSFNQVIATDAIADQIANAESYPRVQYRVATAEKSDLDSGSIDLITVAQALHWFDRPVFYAEARRVLKPNGILAAWSYAKMELDEPQIQILLDNFYFNTIGPYWPPERKLVEEGYRTLEFPFEEIEPPAFTIEAAMTVEEIMGYMRTWSATQRYQKEHGKDPVPDLTLEIEKVWDDIELPVTVEWSLALRVGRAD